jgi:Fe-S cluster assembly ATP-binding protein
MVIMISINLCVSVDDKHILNGISLEIAPGSVHCIMGPNGSGKSTFAQAIMGHPDYQITSGALYLNGVDITQLAVDKRAQAGIFLAFQHPYEIPGVTVFNFLKEAHAALTKHMVSVKEFQELLYAKMALLNMDLSFAQRALNCGFSGGEKKRLELLQLLVLCPKVAILDEIDSGLDVDAMKIVAQGLQVARQENPGLSIIIITHYPRLLSYIVPDHMHIMRKGSIIRSGSAALALAIEQRGYDACF